MRKRFKIFVTIVLAPIIALAFGIYALAANGTASDSATAILHKEPEKGGYFLFYDASEKTFTEHANTEFLTVLNKMDRGDTIKLLSDLNLVLDYHSGKSSANPSTKDEVKDGTSADNLYLDLNGYQLSTQYIREDDEGTRAAGHGYILSPSSDTTFCVYSSDNNHKASLHAVHTMKNGNETNKAGSIFGINGNGAKNVHIYLGEVEEARVINGTSGNYSVAIKACNGDNVNTYAPILFTSSKTSSGNLPYTNSSFNVSGGSHYQVTDAPSTSFINMTCQVDVIARDASFISTIGSPIVSFSRGETEVVSGDKKYYSSPADANLEMTNCTLYTEGTVLYSIYESDRNDEYNTKQSHVRLTNCTLIGKAIHSIEKGAPEYINCKFTSMISGHENEDSTLMARTHITKEIAIYTVKKSNGANGTWTGLWDIEKLGNEEAILYYTAATEDECVDITWSTPSGSETEKWIKSNIFPTPPLFAAASDVYAYDYLPNLSTTEKSGSITYELVPIFKFAIQANVSLYSDFTFNLYIPKAAGDSKTITGKWIENERGVKLSDVTFDKATIQSISGIEHYTVSHNIKATEGDSKYRLVLEMTGAFGEIITKKLDFSIFDYADRVNKADVSDSAKALVNSTKTYIKAAMNYFASGDTPPYPVSANPDVSSVKGTACAIRAGEMSALAKTVLEKATFSPEEQVKILFVFKDGASGKVTFTYPVNLRPASVTVDISKLSHYEITLRAIDLREAIKVDVNSDGVNDYTYSLANYVYFIKNDANYKNNEHLHSLTDAMWAYSEAAHGYLTGDSSDTPAINLSIAGEKITADNYVIVAGEKEYAAAKILNDAIRLKTGESISVFSEPQSGKNSIFINLNEPSLNYDFEVKVNGCDLLINCSFKSFIEGGISAFVNEHISTLNQSRDFSSNFVDRYYTDRVYYSDFDVPTVDMDKVGSLEITVDGKKIDTKNINNWYNRVNGNYRVLESIKNSGLIENALDSLIKTHNFANTTKRHAVYADPGEIYYVNTLDVTSSNQIVIKTNVNWGNAHFILDDSELKKGVSYSADVFYVASYLTPKTITDKATLNTILGDGIGPDTTKIEELALGYRAMIIPTNSSHKIFRRKGAYTGWQGSSMEELVIIDKNGKVDPTTPFVFTYSNLDALTIYNVDIPKLTISDGNVTTIVSEYIEPETTTSDRIRIGRGIDVRRSNTIIENLDHNIIGEHPKAIEAYDEKGNWTTIEQFKGATYTGFFCAAYASDITFYNCKLQARRLYDGGKSSYEISPNFVNNCSFDSCEQTNFYVDPDTFYYNTEEPSKNTMLCLTNTTGSAHRQACWGTMGGNNLKNFSYKNSRISRIDAHEGVCNASVINSDVQTISIGGWGNLLVENSNIHNANPIVSLRSDYGHTWNGTITIKNVDAYVSGKTHTIVSAKFVNWDFGYKCTFPNVIIDGLEFYSKLNLKDLDNPTVPVNDSKYLISASDLGTVNMYSQDFKAESNLHLDTTESSPATYQYKIQDADSDGILDDSEKFPYNSNGQIQGSVVVLGKASRTWHTFTKSDSRGILMSDLAGFDARYGFMFTYGKENLNRITPPEFINIYNNVHGYNYSTYLNNAKKYSTFLNDTDVSFNVHTHTPTAAVTENRVEPTCTENGSYDKVVYCSVCKGEASRETVIIPKLGHTEIAIGDAKAPSCTEPGITAGKACSACKTVIENQQHIPSTGHKYTDGKCTACGARDKLVKEEDSPFIPYR